MTKEKSIRIPIRIFKLLEYSKLKYILLLKRHGYETEKASNKGKNLYNTYLINYLFPKYLKKPSNSITRQTIQFLKSS